MGRQIILHKLNEGLSSNAQRFGDDYWVNGSKHPVLFRSSKPCLLYFDRCVPLLRYNEVKIQARHFPNISLNKLKICFNSTTIWSDRRKQLLAYALYLSSCCLLIRNITFVDVDIQSALFGREHGSDFSDRTFTDELPNQYNDSEENYQPVTSPMQKNTWHECWLEIPLGRPLKLPGNPTKSVSSTHRRPFWYLNNTWHEAHEIRWRGPRWVRPNGLPKHVSISFILNAHHGYRYCVY